MPVWRERYHDREAVVVAGRGLRATVLPEIGAKIVSLVCVETGQELLWCDPDRSPGPLPPHACYADGDRSGVDDCFPTVDPSRWPGAGATGPVKDHGEVWSRPWSSTLEADAAVFECRPDPWPFLLRRRMTTTADQALRMDYEVTTTGGGTHPFQWTGHPLIAAAPGMTIELPDHTPTRTGFATGDRVVPDGPTWDWPSAPTADGGVVDVSRVAGPDAGANEKYWVPTPRSGCRLRYPDGGALQVGCDPDQLPWLAICVDYGGWPADAPAYWVAVEPATSTHDALADSYDAGSVRWARPGRTEHWWWSLTWEPPAPTGGTTW